MEEVVLNLNLKFVLSSLNTFQRGELLTALLGMAETEDETVANLCRYIRLLQPFNRDVIDRGEVTSGSVNDTGKKRALKRKGTKENNNINKNNYKFIYYADEKDDTGGDIPTLEEVQAFATEHGLLVDAEEFVDFYDSHGWRVGKTPIRNWQATMRLWHRRAKKKSLEAADDEAYWSELEETLKERVDEKVAGEEKKKEELEEKNAEISPFAAFIEKLNGNKGEKDDAC